MNMNLAVISIWLHLLFAGCSEPEEFCGNSLVEEGEECDAGRMGSEDIDECCDSNCRLRSGAICSDRNAPCCRGCQLVRPGLKCRKSQPGACKMEAYCSGLSQDCPPSLSQPDGSRCFDRGKCYHGDCIPFCETLGLHSSLCDRDSSTLIIKRQVAAVTQNDSELCKGRSPSEYFRLTADDCRHFVRCSVQGLLTLKCPSGLAFDVESQTCNWKANVKNCQQLEKPRLATPLLATDKPICEKGKLACDNGECIQKELFCNGAPDCPDDSDENACTVDKDPNRAPPCDPTLCVLPDCFCPPDGTQVPGKLESNTVPQMITITFDDAVNNNY